MHQFEPFPGLTMPDPYFFGYGSLVNSATHDFSDPHPARLRGWRRAWRHTDLRQVAFLTAIRDPETEIDGMIAHVPDGDWAALDKREWAYDRIAATQSVSHDVNGDIEIAVYAVPEERHTGEQDSYPILLSYIDVVVQGYLHAFGEDGVIRFVETTDGWDTPILNDRNEPRYPRHQTLKRSETQLVDNCLRAVSARFL